MDMWTKALSHYRPLVRAMKRILDKTGKGCMHRASCNIYEVNVEPIADSDSPT